ncbi:sodium channel and clathrin linker 1-like isoform X2 [Festucalex cinctus]
MESENERLHVNESVGNEPQSLLMDSKEGCGTMEVEELIKDYESLVKLFKQEHSHAMEMWQKAAQEVEQFQAFYHKSFTDEQQNQLVQFIQQTCELKGNNQEFEMTSIHVQITENEQNGELEELHSQLKKTNSDLRTATDKMNEMNEQLECLECQIKKKGADVAEAQRHEESILRQQEENLKCVSKNALEEQTVLETKIGTIQAHCAPVDQNTCEVPNKVHGCVQMPDDALLVQKHDGFKAMCACSCEDVAREWEKLVENNDKVVQQLIREAAVRTRKEEGLKYGVWRRHFSNLRQLEQSIAVDNVREQCNIKLHQIVEQLSNLQTEYAIKESQIERCKNEKKALEKELEKVTKYQTEQDLEKMNALQQKCLNAERIRDDMGVTLQSAQINVKKFEMTLTDNEEFLHSQEEIYRLQSGLAETRKDHELSSAERLQLQQENLQLCREMDELRRRNLQIQNETENQISQMAQECQSKEQTLNAQMMVLEERSRNLNDERLHLIAEQQKTVQRSKDDARNMTKAFEVKIQQLTTELNQQKEQLHELELQLGNNQDTITEYESQLAEYQEKSVCLQKQLTLAEQRAETATQQLSVLTSQQMNNLEAA